MLRLTANGYRLTAYGSREPGASSQLPASSFRLPYPFFFWNSFMNAIRSSTPFSGKAL
jgi:hypothetical protein